MENDKPRRGRPPKIDADKNQENFTKSLEKESDNKENKYVVRSNFFYKGVQFHKDQEIGFNEKLFKLGKIEEKKEDFSL